MKDKKDIKIGIIESTFWKTISEELEKQCVKRLIERGVSEGNINVVRVPGSFEIPLVAEKMATQGIYDALIAFGVIVKGKTYHFEQIANECVRGCADVSRTHGIPVIYEVLAVYDVADATERATRTGDGVESVNKGVSAAEAALSMIDVLASL